MWFKTGKTVSFPEYLPRVQRTETRGGPYKNKKNPASIKVMRLLTSNDHKNSSWAFGLVELNAVLNYSPYRTAIN